jgi:hypothetical protein
MARELNIPIPTGGGGGNLFSRVNPFIIIVGIGMASAISWFFSGGGRSSDSGRMPTTLPEFELGDQIGRQTITGLRTRWEYEVDDMEGWIYEESL